jgi:putative endonuclease
MTDVGFLGEEIARTYLADFGCTIEETNHKTRYSELDILCRKDGILIVVEVRTKVGEKFGSPEDTIGSVKKAKLQKAATAYAYVKNWTGPVRVDAMCIVLHPDFSPKRLDYYENIV